MATGRFSSTEWRQLLNAPQLVHHLLTATDRGTLFTKRSEAKALDEYLGSYQSQSELVQSIIAGQQDADDKIEASPEDTERMLEQVGDLLEARLDDVEGDAVRAFLTDAGEAIAKAAREQNRRGGQAVSAAEQETLAAIASALKAAEADRRRRYEAAVAAEARKQAEDGAFRAERQAEARKRTEEARKKREAEAQKEAEEARQRREVEARELMDESRRQREAEAAREADLARQKSEAEAREMMEAARKKHEAEAAKEAELARQKREAEAAQAAALAAEKEAGTIYVVKPGDTLSGIAKSVYGKAGRWREIFEANRDIIEKPNLIRPGWKLRIPD